MKCSNLWPTVHPKTGYPMHLRCGKCIACLKYRSACWATRNILELSSHHCASFLTLTFDHEHLPPSHNPSHVYNFLRRLRRTYQNPLIRFFSSGEYGSITQRLHYHALIYGWTPSHTPGLIRIDEWPHGLVHFGSVSGASINYTTKYLLKSVSTGAESLRQSSKGIGSDGIISLANHCKTRGVMTVPSVIRFSGKLTPLDAWSRSLWATTIGSDAIVGSILDPFYRYLDDQLEPPSDVLEMVPELKLKL